MKAASSNDGVSTVGGSNADASLERLGNRSSIASRWNCNGCMSITALFNFTKPAVVEDLTVASPSRSDSGATISNVDCTRKDK